MEINGESLIKFYGPLGLIIFGLGIFVWKWLLPRLDKRDEEYRLAINAALSDARAERDYMRQQREKEVDKFLDSLKYRDEQFKSIADAISERRTRQQ